MTDVKINFPSTHFVLSVATLNQLPADTGREIAFAGRSNAGKSSALNAITGNKKLAKTSKTPGRTQLINFFAINETSRIVDLPGYGYAQVATEIKERWQKTLIKYLETRQSLCGLILIMDIRHPFKEYDMLMLDWAKESNLPIHILLSKADKLSRNAANKTWQTLQPYLKKYPQLSMQMFSATSYQGLADARLKILEWLELS